MRGRNLLAPPRRTRLRWTPVDPPPVSDRAPDLRARHRAEAVAAFTTTREEEIDPVPSSRPAALVEQGFPWASPDDDPTYGEDGAADDMAPGDFGID